MSDLILIRSEITNMEADRNYSGLAVIARSLVAELDDLKMDYENLKDSTKAKLEPEEEWPRFEALTSSENMLFAAWLDQQGLPTPSAFTYFPWDLARWRALQAEKEETQAFPDVKSTIF